MSSYQRTVRDVVEQGGYLYFALSCGHLYCTFARPDYANCCNRWEMWRLVEAKRRKCWECEKENGE